MKFNRLISPAKSTPPGVSALPARDRLEQLEPLVLMSASAHDLDLTGTPDADELEADMSPDAGCFGNAVIKTPALDALAKDGIRLPHAFCTTAGRGSRLVHAGEACRAPITRAGSSPARFARRAVATRAARSTGEWRSGPRSPSGTCGPAAGFRAAAWRLPRRVRYPRQW